ncbi:ribosomal large subunit pseudouridine synthase B [Nitrosomonas cryotolerans]|uniref:Pseudouridine synthase n=1 Tax=Nitrosomonas cryotolerans ATCC 49181 TaxID=1131553 RepID=A0A1N6IXZ0_9PROT|nr:pseudouridine synthase [Nitrosomonas cryotolerans]SFQ01665.1 ribosomal large subunit pseudouridine synthase B [Nitrosomonas cryotolerans]SIO36968.1 ribosomal large subunit pseudouridine synthase B [Nitrosomonas cryotolerans ATCC 49181]
MSASRPIRPVKKKSPASSGANAADVSVLAITHKLHKLLAQKGLGSRREMEALIAAGQVSINGKVAVTGDRVGPEDIVRLGKRIIRFSLSEPSLPRVMLYHKPEGEIVSRNDPEGRPSVFDKLPHLKSSKWIAIGRLDFNTSGLLIFTTDGVLANRLMHPRFEVEREYAVRLIGRLTAEQILLLTTGIELEDGFAKFNRLSDQGGEGSNHWYHVVLKEGKNREVRRMFAAVGLSVSRLMRVRFGPINLPPRIKRGKWLELDEKETRRLLNLVA